MILAITESTTPLTVRSLGTLLRARAKTERVENYSRDLVYMLAKHYYDGLPVPSEVVAETMKPPAKPPTARDVIDGVRRKLRG